MPEVKRGVVRNDYVMNGSNGNVYLVPLNHCSSEERLFFLVCEALQLYPVGVDIMVERKL